MVYLNNQYFAEIKEKLKDYIVKLNLTYIKFSDVQHICNRSEFRRLCDAKFFVKDKDFVKRSNNSKKAYWRLSDGEWVILPKRKKILRR